MKRTVLAFTAMLAATGFSMANEVHAKQPHHPVAQGQGNHDQRVDCRRDSSGRYYGQCVALRAKPKLGIDIDAFWIMQNLHP